MLTLLQFDVVIGVLIGEEGIEVQIGYWDNCMTHEYVTRLGEAYVDVLGEIVRGGGSRVGELGVGVGF